MLLYHEYNVWITQLSNSTKTKIKSKLSDMKNKNKVS